MSEKRAEHHAEPLDLSRWEGLDPATIAIIAGRGPEEPGLPMNVPPVLTSVFKTGPGILYARAGNPTWSAFEETVGALEGGTCLAFSSGMGAVSAVLNGLSVGAKVVFSADSYTGTRLQLERMADKGGLSPVAVDVTDTEAVIEACEGAELLWLESPTNPMLSIPDIARLAAAGHDRGATVVVDNTFATPLLQRPFELGADIVIHSASKFISGHSDLIMGLAITRDEGWHDELLRQRTLGGAIPGPLETYLALRGLRTLPVRLEKAQSNAIELARRLEEHPAIERVIYPGLASHPDHEIATRQMRGPGAMLCFVVAGGADAADAACERVQVITHATSLGGIDTSMERRSRWEGENAPEGLIRMSVGCEAIEDLWTDLTKALG
jgi:cystathionine gamma-synthase